jgi:hypothetical protein
VIVFILQNYKSRGGMKSIRIEAGYNNINDSGTKCCSPWKLDITSYKHKIIIITIQHYRSIKNLNNLMSISQPQKHEKKISQYLS